MASSQQNPEPLNYAARPAPQVNNLLWLAWLVGLVVLPAAGYTAYHALWDLNTVRWLAGHRLAAGLGGLVVLVLDLWFLRYVLVEAKRVQVERDLATGGMPGSAAESTFCRKCDGPFPTSELVVIPASPRKTWIMRGVSFVLLASVVVFMALLVTDHLSIAIGSAPLVLATIVGMNLWRYSREATEKCPRCGSTKVVAGTTPLGCKLFQDWQLKSRG